MEEKGDEHKGQLTPVEQLQQRPTDFFIVGIGASAGGIQALQEFFRHVPADSGMAYVVILHLSPDHDSQLASVLQHETQIPVAQITEKTVIHPDHIYVVPPDRHLTMDDGYIAVMANLQIEDRRAPVDIFFRTLADHHGPRAISVILSGTGANGSMGLKRVKERGGAAFVQNPREAEFNEMPRNAIATDLVDEVLNVAEIPVKLISYKKNNGRVQITADAEQRTEDQQQALREIFTLLRHRTGHDFSNYKRPTLLRRIERRISVHDLNSLPAYAQFLQENADEPTALLKDLLISVTNFFRDKKAFDAVEQDIIPLLLSGKKADDQVRIWVAGCATGEEAYSFAMLCLEKTMGLLDVPKIQIFATDIDEQAIAHAREGYYTLNDAADVSPDRLRHFFNKEGDGYRVRRELRETVMFATHNFLKDPPFSHLDLVSCRNVMIYLNQVAQERVVETFHFALKPGAYLFLGNSESVDGASDLYAGFNREYHIFQSRQVKQRAYPVPESTPALYFDKFKKEPATLEQENKILERISFGDLHQQLLEQYAPPSIVVNEEYDILHLTERAGKYLQIGGGELSQNLLKLVKPELRLELRSALYQAVQRQSAVETRGLKVTVGDTAETINIQVRPVLRSGDTAKGFMLVIFEPATDHIGKEVLLSSDEPVARQLEEELIRVKAQLRAANEQHDFQAEEMKASNEELQAMNEELRSAAEELETSKEELQSMNEELRTVNQELKVKIEETSITSNNLNNLINSTNIGTIFLDRGFRVVLFTPAAREIFNLRASDYGRPLSDITGSLEYGNFLQDAENVLERLVELEKEVKTKNGGIYLMRITPYRTDEDRIKGVVITFLDITERKKADEALQKSEDRFRSFVTASSDVVYRMSADWKEMFTMNGKNFLQDTDTPSGNWIETYIPGDERAQVWKVVEEAIAKKRLFQLEHRVIRADGSMGWALSRALPILNKANEIEEWTGAASDITLRKQAEQELQNFNTRLEQEVADRTGELNSSRELLQATLDSSIQMIQVFEAVRDGEGKIIDFIWVLNNAVSEKIYGDVINKSLLEHNPGVVTEGIFKGFVETVETGIPKQYEMHYVHEQFDGWFEQSVVKLNDGVATSTVDITERKKAEMALKDSRDTLQSVFDTTLIGMSVFTAVRNEANEISDLKIVLVNRVIEEKTGRKDLEGKLYAQEFPGVKDTGLFDVMVKVIETGEPVQYEYLYAYEGFDNWFSSMFVKMGDGLVATNLDITERKRAESERMKSLTLLQQSEDVALMGSWDYDLRSKAFSWSDGMYRLFGLEKDIKIEPEIYGQYATPGCRDVAARIAGYIKQGTEDFEETLSITINDTKKTVKIKATVIKDNDGRPARVLGVDIDITAAREAEEKMRLMEGERQLEILRTTLRTQEEERKRISESLHNGLGQLLYAIRISMNELNPAAAKKDVNEFAASKAYTEGLLTDAIKESRRISHELMPMVLEEFGLEAAINDVCQQLGEQVKFQCTIDLKGTSPDEYMQLAIFRTVQELMLNVVKHAGATRADVYIVALENNILIKVEDNGNGVEEPAPGKKGIGLSSIRSKASLLNGSVNISSNPGTGTIVEVIFEVTNQKG